ncbi:DUF262 domain-containing protein [Shewanella schlegeliana]|nr:DUF262 domain-containing protein [Shewanella schlegeliana]
MTPRVEPRVYFIDDVIGLMSKGRLVMPDFQRNYVWKHDQILELFDSIYRGYPIGSVLVWSPTESLELSASEYIIDHYIGIDREASYIIDGQQRLTTFFMCLYTQEKHVDHKWNVYFDLKNEKFVHIKKNTSNVKPYFFELRKARSTTAFLKESIRISNETHDDELITRAQNLVDKITKYRLAVTELSGGTVEQAIEIFTRLNREGRRVSEIDYVRALSKKSGSDKLDKLLEGADAIIDKYGFNQKDGRNFNLKIIQSAFNFPVYADKNSWKLVASRISGTKDENVIDRVLNALEQSILFSINELKLVTISHYPYITQFYMIFSYFYNNLEYDYKLLANEFYYAAIKGIPQTNPSTTEKLIEYYRNGFIFNEELQDLEKYYFSSNTLKLEDKFNASSASSKLLFNIIVNYEYSSGKHKFDVGHFIYPPKNKLRNKEFSNLLGNKVFCNNDFYKQSSVLELNVFYKTLYEEFEENTINYFNNFHIIKNQS